jgi:hypothetical protein
MNINWKYNDCWYERYGATLTEKIFENYWDAQEACDLANYQDLCENSRFVLKRNTNIHKALLEKGYCFYLNEFGVLEFCPTDKEKQQLAVGRLMTELGLNKFEILQIPKSKLK